MPDGAADAHGEDLAAFVRALGLSKVRIVAHSSGAHAALFFAALHPDMVVSPALNEPPAAGILIGTANGAEILKEFASNLAPAREALKVGDTKTRIPLFVDGVGTGSRMSLRSSGLRLPVLIFAWIADLASFRKQPPPLGCVDR